MNILWFRPTANGILYILPTITYIVTDTYLKGYPDRITGKATLVNFVWLYWAIVVSFNFRPNT